MTVPQELDLEIRRAIARELIPDGVVLRYRKPDGTVVRAFAIRWVDRQWRDGRHNPAAVPLLTQAVRNSTPARRVISIPDAVLDLARLLGCERYVWRCETPGGRWALGIRLDELEGRALAERHSEVFVRLDDLEPLPLWPAWAFVADEVDVEELLTVAREELRRATATLR